jgi:ATP-dependent helicase/nuclease subunit B
MTNRDKVEKPDSMPEFRSPRLFLGRLASLEDTLSEQIAEIRQERPLSPITIIVENTMLVPYLRQCLSYSDNGHINLQIETPARLADRFTREILAASKRPMPKYGDRILARTIAERRSGTYFRPVAYSSGFAETLRGLFREFHQAGITPAGLEHAVQRTNTDGTVKLTDITSLFQQFESTRGQFFTPDDLVAAVDSVDPDTIRQLLWTPVFVYGIWSPTGIQRRLFHKLMASGIELRFLLPQTDTDADDVHLDLRNWLTSLGAEPESREDQAKEVSSLSHLRERLFRSHEEPAALDGHVRLLSAPDAPREVREAARTCLKWAEEGIPFHRMAIVYRHSEPYRTLIDQVFQRAGIVTYLHSGRPLISEPSGQRLLTLLNLIDADLPRSSVMEFITETVLPEATRNRYRDNEVPIHPARWDQITREAGIVQGRDQWLHRLDLLESSKREFIDPDAEVAEDDPLEAELREITRLRDFIRDFGEMLAGARDEASWSNHLQFLKTIAETYIDGIGDLLDQVSTLEMLEQVSERVSFERFRETVRYWLLRQNSVAIDSDRGNQVPPGQFGRSGVNVFDIGSLRHLRFDGVIILGVAERQFPPPPRQDPLLLDRERALLNSAGGWQLPMRSQRSEEETMTFTVAVHAARERLQISYPRSEAGSTRSYLPSHFFRATASALAGRDIEAGEVDTLDTSLFTRVPAGSFLPPDGTLPLDDHEYDRILLEQDRELGLRVVGNYRPGIPRGREADENRRSQMLTVFDGRVEPDAAREIAWTAGRGRRAISPSRLETFAACPFRFFLKYVLRLEPLEEPETLERIDALHRGSLIHEILELFLQDLRTRGERPSPEQRDRHLSRLDEIARAACERMESTGLVGYPVLWEYDQIAIMEDLEEWYDREAADLSQNSLQPETFELRFGWARHRNDGGKGSRDEPFTLSFPGGDMRFQGRVDRVDIMPDRSSFRVIDYKTGRSNYYQPDTFNGGRSLQLPIYLLATSDLLGVAWKPSQAEYFFPTRRGEFQRVPLHGDWLTENHDDLVELLSGIAQAIENGLFPQITNIGNQDNCRFCDFKELCPVNVRSIAQRKKADEAVIWLRKTIEAEG